MGVSDPAIASQVSEVRGKSAWDLVGNVACELTVDLPVPEFRLVDLVKLGVGSVVNTHWLVGNDVPLRGNAQLVAWCEFEVSEGRLAVRMTELA